MKITTDINADTDAGFATDEFTVELENGGKFTITESSDQLRIINETLGFICVTVQSKDVIAIKSEW